MKRSIKARHGVAWLLAAALTFGPPSASGWAQDDDETLGGADAAACATAAEPADCLLPILLRFSMAKQTLVMNRVPGAAPSGDASDRVLAMIVAALRSDAAGAAPDLTLADASRLSSGDATIVYMAICMERIRPIPLDAGPATAAWLRARRPSDALVGEVAKRLDPVAQVGPHPDLMVAVGAMTAAACRNALGIETGRPPSPPPGDWDPSDGLMVLTVSLQFDRALSAAQASKPSDMPIKSPLFKWVFLQRERIRILTTAISAGRPDIADKAALMIIDKALAADRPSKAVMDSGVPRALGWLTSRPGQPGVAAALEKLDPFVRPGQRGWIDDDAIAVHKAWLSIGRADRAKVYADALRAEARKPAPRDTSPHIFNADGALDPERLSRSVEKQDGWQPPRAYVVSILAEDEGDWDRSTDLVSGFFADMTARTAPRNLEFRLSRLKDPHARAVILSMCTDPQNAGPLEPDRFDPLPLDVAAGCARRLPEAARLVEVGENDGPPLDVAGPILALATRAAVSDRPDLAREMLVLALKTRHGDLTDKEAQLMALCVIFDLHARGRL